MTYKKSAFQKYEFAVVFLVIDSVSRVDIYMNFMVNFRKLFFNKLKADKCEIYNQIYYLLCDSSYYKRTDILNKKLVKQEQLSKNEF